MSLVTYYSVDEFTSEFPIDLGEGVRGELIHTEAGFDGLIINHLVGKYVCSMVISVAAPLSLWGFVNRDPAQLTVSGPPIKCINCPENLTGSIENGKWVTKQ